MDILNPEVWGHWVYMDFWCLVWIEPSLSKTGDLFYYFFSLSLLYFFHYWLEVGNLKFEFEKAILVSGKSLIIFHLVCHS